jgi:hypothetical protein
VNSGELLVSIVYRHHDGDAPGPKVEVYSRPLVASELDAVLGLALPPAQGEALTDTVVKAVQAGEVAELTYVQLLWATCRDEGEYAVEELRSLIRRHNQASLTLILDEVDGEADCVIGREVPWSRRHKPKH